MSIEIGDYVVLFYSENKIIEGKVAEIDFDEIPKNEDLICYVRIDGDSRYHIYNPSYGDYIVSKELLNTKIGQLIYGDS